MIIYFQRLLEGKVKIKQFYWKQRKFGLDCRKNVLSVGLMKQKQAT